MDALKVLGDLLGNQSMARGGVAQQVLKGILGGGAPQRAPATRATAPAQRAPARREPARREPARQEHHHEHRGGGRQDDLMGGLIRGSLEGYNQRQQRSARGAPDAGACPTEYPGGLSQHDANEQAKILIRAMVNAAKADGQIDRKEQDSIVGRLGDVSRDEVEFLQHEFAQPLDVKAFARSIPQGLEQQVYAISLTAIDLDTNPEARYLHELGHELGLSHDMCNQIHNQLGAPQLYR